MLSQRLPGSKAEFRWSAVVKAVAVGIATCALLWFTLVFTFAMMGTNAMARPVAPLWLASTVKAQAASALLERGNPSPRDLGTAQRLAADVVRHEPANVTAIRSLGLVAASLAGGGGKAERLFAYAETLSRRDLPTQLWLIERRVAANDVAGALTHYDRALRTNLGAREILIPVLVEAAQQPSVTVPLAKLLEGRPLWWAEFTQKFIYEGGAPDALALIIGRLRLSTREEGERNFLSQAMSTLVQAGAPDKAYALFREAGGGAVTPTMLIRNGGFESDAAIVPFDWFFVDEADLSAVRERRDDAGAGWVLSLSAQNGSNGVLARQLLMLGPGRYQIRARGGDMPADAASTPAISLVCTGQAGTTIAVLRYPAARARVAVGASFTVPAQGCAAVWLLVSRSAPLDRESTTPWIDALVIRRA